MKGGKIYCHGTVAEAPVTTTFFAFTLLGLVMHTVPTTHAQTNLLLETAWRTATGKKFRSVEVGQAGVWMVSEADSALYYRNGSYGKEGATDFDVVIKVEENIEQVSVGTDSVLALRGDGVPLLRMGITPLTPTGTSWQPIKGIIAKYVTMSNRGHIWVIEEDGYCVYRRGANLKNPRGRSWDRFVGADRDEERIVSSNSHQNRVKRSYWDRWRPPRRQTQSPDSYRGGRRPPRKQTQSPDSYRGGWKPPRRQTQSPDSYRGGWKPPRRQTQSPDSYRGGWKPPRRQNQSPGSYRAGPPTRRPPRRQTKSPDSYRGGWKPPRRQTQSPDSYRGGRRPPRKQTQSPGSYRGGPPTRRPPRRQTQSPDSYWAGWKPPRRQTQSPDSYRGGRRPPRKQTQSPGSYRGGPPTRRPPRRQTQSPDSYWAGWRSSTRQTTDSTDSYWPRWRPPRRQTQSPNSYWAEWRSSTRQTQSPDSFWAGWRSSTMQTKSPDLYKPKWRPPRRQTQSPNSYWVGWRSSTRQTQSPNSYWAGWRSSTRQTQSPDSFWAGWRSSTRQTQSPDSYWAGWRSSTRQTQSPDSYRGGWKPPRRQTQSPNSYRGGRRPPRKQTQSPGSYRGGPPTRRPPRRQTQSPDSYWAGWRSSTRQTTDSTDSYWPRWRPPRRQTQSPNSYWAEWRSSTRQTQSPDSYWAGWRSSTRQNKSLDSYWPRWRPPRRQTHSPDSYWAGWRSSTRQTTDSTDSYRGGWKQLRRRTESTNSYSLRWTLSTSQSEHPYPQWKRFPPLRSQTTVPPTTQEWTVGTAFFPTKTSASTPLQAKIKVIPSTTTEHRVGPKFKQLSLGSSGLWGTTQVGEVYYREGTFGDPDTPGIGWTLVPSSIPVAHVTSGEGVVYAVDQGNDVYYRFGILPDVPTGSDWVPLQGSLLQVSAGAFTVWGIRAGDEKVVVRRAENWMQLERDEWTRIRQVQMKHVACGDGGMWGVSNDARAVYYRQATRKTRGLSRGSRDWVQVELPAGVSGVNMLDVGQNVVWMLDNTGQLFIRNGMSDVTPKGTSWSSLPSHIPFSSVSVSHASTVWATDAFQRVYRRKGARTSNPFGTSWDLIQDEGVIQVSVGQSGVWGVSGINRTALYRVGTYDYGRVTGTEWRAVNPPLPLHQISAGENMVWAVAMDKSAWFLYGIDQNRPQGREWHPMPAPLLQVDVMDEYPTVCAINKNAVVYSRPRNGF